MENADRESVVRVELLHRSLEGEREVHVDRVHRLWSVQRDQQDLVANFGQYFIGHSFISNWRRRKKIPIFRSCKYRAT